jgi:hypothetical protein
MTSFVELKDYRDGQVFTTMAESTINNMCVKNKGEYFTVSKFMLFCLLLLFSSSSFGFDDKEVSEMLHTSNEDTELKKRQDVFMVAQIELVKTLISERLKPNTVSDKRWDEIEQKFKETIEKEFKETDELHVNFFSTVRFIYSTLFELRMLVKAERPELESVTYAFSFAYAKTRSDDANRHRYPPFKRAWSAKEVKCNNGSLCSEAKMFAYLHKTKVNDLEPINGLLTGGIAYWVSDQRDKDPVADKYCLNENSHLFKPMVNHFKSHEYEGASSVRSIKDLQSLQKVIGFNGSEVATRYAMPCPGCQKNYCNFMLDRRIEMNLHEDCAEDAECSEQKRSGADSG